MLAEAEKQKEALFKKNLREEDEENKQKHPKVTRQREEERKIKKL